MAKASKQFKKFASSGKLKDTIKSRRQHQQKRRKFEEKVENRKKQRGAARDEFEDSDGEDEEKDVKAVDSAGGGRAGGVAKNVEELFGEGGLDVEDEEGSELEDLDSEEDEDDDDEGSEGEEEDDLLDEEAMKKTMKSLAKTDPEFYKYLQENDSELLEFGKEAKGSKAAAKGKGKKVDEDVEMDSDDEDEAEEDEDEDEDAGDLEPTKTSVTLRMLREWQNGMIKVGLPLNSIYREPRAHLSNTR